MRGIYERTILFIPWFVNIIQLWCGLVDIPTAGPLVGEHTP